MVSESEGGVPRGMVFSVHQQETQPTREAGALRERGKLRFREALQVWSFGSSRGTVVTAVFTAITTTTVSTVIWEREVSIGV